MKKAFLLALITWLGVSCTPEEVTIPEGEISIEISEVYKTPQEYHTRLHTVVDKTVITLNSDSFRRRIMLADMKGTQGRNNSEVYQSMVESKLPIRIQATDLGPGRGGTYNEELNLIRINSYYIDRTHQVVGTLAHEWLHSLGYEHTGMGDRKSVPYAIGSIVQDLNR